MIKYTTLTEILCSRKPLESKGTRRHLLPPCSLHERTTTIRASAKRGISCSRASRINLLAGCQVVRTELSRNPGLSSLGCRFKPHKFYTRHGDKTTRIQEILSKSESSEDRSRGALCPVRICSDQVPIEHRPRVTIDSEFT